MTFLKFLRPSPHTGGGKENNWKGRNKDTWLFTIGNTGALQRRKKELRQNRSWCHNFFFLLQSFSEVVLWDPWFSLEGKSNKTKNMTKLLIRTFLDIDVFGLLSWLFFREFKTLFWFEKFNETSWQKNYEPVSKFSAKSQIQIHLFKISYSSKSSTCPNGGTSSTTGRDI